MSDATRRARRESGPCYTPFLSVASGSILPVLLVTEQRSYFVQRQRRVMCAGGWRGVPAALDRLEELSQTLVSGI